MMLSENASAHDKVSFSFSSTASSFSDDRKPAAAEALEETDSIAGSFIEVPPPSLAPDTPVSASVWAAAAAAAVASSDVALNNLGGTKILQKVIEEKGMKQPPCKATTVKKMATTRVATTPRKSISSASTKSTKTKTGNYDKEAKATTPERTALAADNEIWKEKRLDWPMHTSDKTNDTLLGSEPGEENGQRIWTSTSIQEVQNVEHATSIVPPKFLPTAACVATSVTVLAEPLNTPLLSGRSDNNNNNTNRSNSFNSTSTGATASSCDSFFGSRIVRAAWEKAVAALTTRPNSSVRNSTNNNSNAIDEEAQEEDQEEFGYIVFWSSLIIFLLVMALSIAWTVGAQVASGILPNLPAWLLTTFCFIFNCHNNH